MMLLALDVLAVFAALGWAGGLVTLGALVAPIIFSSGEPHAPDLMAAIFLRFDRVAVTCAATLLVAEATRRFASDAAARTGSRLRVALALVLAACAGIQAGYLSPRIVTLYESGLQSGMPAFDRVHHASEHLGKLTLVAAVAYAWAVLRSRRPA